MAHITAPELTPQPTTPAETPGGRPVRARRSMWLLAGLAATALAVQQVVDGPARWWLLVLLALMPDLSLLAAVGADIPAHDIGGRIPRRAVRPYNLVHTPAVPLLLTALAAVEVVPRAWAVAGLAWFAHIAIDRGVGYGLRDADGLQRG